MLNALNRKDSSWIGFSCVILRFDSLSSENTGFMYGFYEKTEGRIFV